MLICFAGSSQQRKGVILCRARSDVCCPANFGVVVHSESIDHVGAGTEACPSDGQPSAVAPTSFLWIIRSSRMMTSMLTPHFFRQEVSCISFSVGSIVGFVECQIDELFEYSSRCSPDDLVFIFEEACLAGNPLSAANLLPVVAVVCERR